MVRLKKNFLIAFGVLVVLAAVVGYQLHEGRTRCYSNRLEITYSLFLISTKEDRGVYVQEIIEEMLKDNYTRAKIAKINHDALQRAVMREYRYLNLPEVKRELKQK